METTESEKKSGRKKLVFLVIFLIAAVIAAFLWWWDYRKYISTDDANLDSYRVSVASRVMAPVLSLNVWEGDSVTQGMTMLELDSSAVIASLNEASARLEELYANLNLARVRVVTSQKNLEVKEISDRLTVINYERAKKQYEGGAIPLESYQNMEEAYQASRVELEVLKSEVVAAKAQILSIEASVKAAEASIEAVRIELGYYRIIAPVSGRIAMRWVLPGDIVQPGQTIYTINEGDSIWVQVYLEESKFSSIRMGQQSKFTLDAYSGLTFWGHIFYIGSNAASQFSLIPPNNASGNYTKVEQRIPVKISIDSVSGKKDLQDIDLVSGMSATVKIIK